MAKQAASSFLIAQLSERVLRAKELETFHALSTFLLHDLKNFVALLSLVVQNMERNFDNPAFRSDALASVSETVHKMAGLMKRLAMLSYRPELSLAATDLNAVVRETLAEMRESKISRLHEDLQDVPSVLLDAASMKTVITNLVLNARDAVADRGEIRVATGMRDGMATLTVSDNGVGMTGNFLETRLFKPLSTTKSNGFGIGLYQCKSIVEAHGGRIEVTSEPGKGSSFTVLIPVDKD
jgi:putative PEP-CTERM system histidine kinase